MQSKIRKIVIVGGGTAGWLTAGLIASQHMSSESDVISVTLIESPNVDPIGVGEGTWPSMRDTLKKIGISETSLLMHCDASFKQASMFIDWEKLQKESQSHYYHPFSVPAVTNKNIIKQYFSNGYTGNESSFSQAMCHQSVLCENNLAPKLVTTKEHSFVANYGYHLDAGKFSKLVRQHCVNQLNVEHLVSHVVEVNNSDNGDILSVSTEQFGDVFGDLFIDCTGRQSLLLGKHYNIPFISRRSVLFNDTALAVQVPYEEDNTISSSTLSTAKSAGWIWDIGLQSRKGVGYVYSSSHISDSAAEKELHQYISKSLSTKNLAQLSFRKLSIDPGHYEKFWHKNCVAVGMSAGFIEPLEASALVMIEESAKMISEQLPETRTCMDLVAKRFNQKFLLHWQQIVDFLKLHYVLSKRVDSDYWLDARDDSTIPNTLQELLHLWQYQVPSNFDIPHSDPLFSSTSYQYVLFGMHAKLNYRQQNNENSRALEFMLAEINKKRRQLEKVLPSNRELINSINQYEESKF